MGLLRKRQLKRKKHLARRFFAYLNTELYADFISRIPFIINGNDKKSPNIPVNCINMIPNTVEIIP